jgi:hypothetical protein
MFSKKRLPKLREKYLGNKIFPTVISMGIKQCFLVYPIYQNNVSWFALLWKTWLRNNFPAVNIVCVGLIYATYIMRHPFSTTSKTCYVSRQ